MTKADDTGRISTRMHARVARDTGSADADQFLDAVATKLVAKVNGGPPRKRFLGLDAGSWTKLLVGWGIALAVFLGTWYLSVRDGLKERPTLKQVDGLIHSEVGEHEQRGSHPVLEGRLDEVESEQQTIRESQIRQEAIDRRQTEILEEVKDDVKRIRRRQR